MKNNITMTQGPLFKNILFFSIPLMLSNLLQALFNLSDIAVVGRFGGPTALGSVGSCAILVSLFVGLMIGMGSGVNAIVARYLGENNKQKIRSSAITSLFISIAYGILIMSIGLLFVKSILVFMNTKEELLGGAVLYMRIYLLGTPALAIYNCGSGILSAAGDSKRPLIYLTTSGIINIVLNLVFVICFSLDVLGVALASIISQYISAILIVLHLTRAKEDYAFKFEKFHWDLSSFRNILLIGFSAGIQNAVFSFANLFIQTAVNSFDTVMVEGNSAAANADTIIYDMMAAFYVAATSFIAQNYGAGKMDRIRKSYFICLSLSFGVAAVLGGLLLLFGNQFLSIFTADKNVIDAGMKRISIMACSYCISAFMDNTIAASRGFGKTLIPTTFVILGSCVFRIIWIYTVFRYFHTIPSLYLLYAFSWIITAVFEIFYFKKVYQIRKKIYNKSTT